MSPSQKKALVLVLLLSAMISFAICAVQSPRGAPDEGHHYSFIKYIAEHLGEFPIDYKAVYTGSATAENRNHLIHPPLYYYLMAGVFHFMDPTKDYTAIGRAQDQYGAISIIPVIPILRSISLLFVLIGLYGLYLLLNFLVERCALNGFLAVGLGALVSLIPEFTYIGGALNNDALAMAIWPFLMLSMCRLLFENKLVHCWSTVFFSMCAVLTKATLWPLALCCLIVTVVTTTRRAMLRRPQEKTAFPVGWFTLAVIATSLAILHLSANTSRYGTLQPNYVQVYGFTPKESKFYALTGREDEVARFTVTDVAHVVGLNFMKTTAGTLGQKERFYAENPELLLAVFGFSVMLIGLSSFGYFRARSIPREAKFITAFFFVVPIVFCAVYVIRNYMNVRMTGYLSGQGRYLIGYLPLFLVSLGLLGSGWGDARKSFERMRRGAATVGFLGLTFIFLRPSVYLSNSLEIYVRSQISTVVEKTLSAEGFRPLDLHLFSVTPGHESSFVDKDSLGLRNYYHLDWDNAWIEGPLEAPEGAKGVTLAFLLRGNSIMGKQAQLAVSIAKGADKDSTGKTGAVLSAEPHVEIYRAFLAIPPAVKQFDFRLTLLNYRTRHIPVIGGFYAPTRAADLYAVYARFEESANQTESHICARTEENCEK